MPHPRSNNSSIHAFSRDVTNDGINASVVAGTAIPLKPAIRAVHVATPGDELAHGLTGMQRTKDREGMTDFVSVDQFKQRPRQEVSTCPSEWTGPRLANVDQAAIFLDDAKQVRQQVEKSLGQAVVA